MSFQISNFCISQRCQPHLIQNITCHSVLDYQWTNYTLFHTEWTTFLAEGCSTCQGSHGLCYAPSKTAREAERSRCFSRARGAAVSADIHPRQLWDGAVTPGTSAWTTRSLAGHVCPHRAACSPGGQNGASSRRGERERRGVNRFTCQYEGNQLVVVKVLKNTYDDRRSSSTGEAGN